MSEIEFTGMHQVNGKRIFYRDQFRDATAHSAISSAKARLLIDHPFWGFMGIDLVLIEVPASEMFWGNRTATLATDGYHIFYSASFINSLPLGQVEFAVAHEIYHCLWGHTSGIGKVNRREDRDSRLWGIACDHFINIDLKDAGIGEFITVIPIHCNEKYRGWAVERIYEDLLENPPPKGQETLDVHIEFEITPDGKPSAQASDQAGDQPGDGTTSIRITISQEHADSEEFRWMQTAQRAIAHVENSSQGADSIPAHLRRLIGEMTKPIINWKMILRKFVVSIIKTGYSFTRPDKRSFNSGITLPGYRRTDTKLIIAVAFDTSGSVSDEALRKFVNELLGILLGYSSYEIHAFCFEGDVDESTYKVIRKTHKSAKADLIEYAEHISGCGGTCFQSIWDFMRAKKIRPRGLAVFTDGYPLDDSWHTEGSYCPTMFITVGNRDDWKAPFGHTIAYEDM